MSFATTMPTWSRLLSRQMACANFTCEITSQSITSCAEPMMAMFCTWLFQNPHTQNFLLLSLAGNSSAFRLVAEKGREISGDALLTPQLELRQRDRKNNFPGVAILHSFVSTQS